MNITNQLNQVRVLGSGTSTGIPFINCSCNVCTSKDTKDKRLRTSIYIEDNYNNSILVDTSPDFRQQCLSNNIKKIDTVIITHDHADHTHGIDDLRQYTYSRDPLDPLDRLNVHINQNQYESFKQKFSYIFNFKSDKKPIGGGIPLLNLNPLDPDNTLNFNESNFEFLVFPHGRTKTLGVIHNKSFAYMTDCNVITGSQLNYLNSLELDLIIIDCLRKKPHQTHLHFDRTIEYISKIKPKRAGLIHFSHDWTHQELTQLTKYHSDKLSIEIFPTFDGQILSY